MNKMDLSNEELLRAAKERVARLFHVKPNTIAHDSVFGVDIKTSFVSDWKLNEFDVLLNDIHDVADSKTRKELSSGEKVIKSVGDYCEYMLQCYQIEPEAVVQVLFEPNN